MKLKILTVQIIQISVELRKFIEADFEQGGGRRRQIQDIQEALPLESPLLSEASALRTKHGNFYIPNPTAEEGWYSDR